MQENKNELKPLFPKISSLRTSKHLNQFDNLDTANKDSSGGLLPPGLSSPIKTNFFQTNKTSRKTSKLKRRARNLTTNRIERDTQILSSINMQSIRRTGPYLKSIDLRNRSTSSKREPRRDKTPKRGVKTHKTLKIRRSSIPTVTDRLAPQSTQSTNDVTLWLKQ